MMIFVQFYDSKTNNKTLRRVREQQRRRPKTYNAACHVNANLRPMRTDHFASADIFFLFFFKNQHKQQTSSSTQRLLFESVPVKYLTKVLLYKKYEFSTTLQQHLVNQQRICPYNIAIILYISRTYTAQRV